MIIVVVSQSNFCINCDKYPADYCVIFYDSEVLSVFNFVVGYLRVMRVVSRQCHLKSTKGLCSLSH